MNKPHLRYKNQNEKERTWTIHFLSITKFIKGLLLILVSIKLLTLINKDIQQVFSDFINRHGIDPENSMVQKIAEKLVGIDKKQLTMFSIGSFSYSALLLTEGFGLWFQKRWAEYLTVIATSLLLPLEIYEIYEKFTWVRIGILLLNLFIVWYLATRLKDEKIEELEKSSG